MSRNGYANTIGGWKKLLEAVSRNEGDLPGADSLRAALERHLQDAEAAKARKLFHRAESQRATKEKEQQLAAGREVASRLCSLVKSALGPRNERLGEFGIAPVQQRSRNRRTSQQQPPAGSSSPVPAK
jgi:hypothetical protein